MENHEGYLLPEIVGLDFNSHSVYLHLQLSLGKMQMPFGGQQ